MAKPSKKQIKKISSFNTVFIEENDGGFSVTVPSLPGCVSQGDSFESALRNIKEAIELYLEEDKGSPNYGNTQREFMVPVEVNV